MEPHCISFREIPDTTKIFATFLDDFENVAKYFAYPPDIEGVLAAARKVQLDPGVRKEHTAPFGPADRILFYTDGISEARDT